MDLKPLEGLRNVPSAGSEKENDTARSVNSPKTF